MPFKTAIGTTLDSGDFAQIMDSAEEMADLGGFDARKADSEARGRRRGLGYGNLLEACGAGIADRAATTRRARARRATASVERGRTSAERDS